MMLIDGFNSAIIGQTLTSIGKEKVEKLVYDGWKMCDVLIDRDGMTPDEAFEYVEYNCDGANLGPKTPIIMWAIDDIDLMLEDINIKEEDDGKRH